MGVNFRSERCQKDYGLLEYMIDVCSRVQDRAFNSWSWFHNSRNGVIVVPAYHRGIAASAVVNSFFFPSNLNKTSDPISSSFHYPSQLYAELSRT